MLMLLFSGPIMLSFAIQELHQRGKIPMRNMVLPLPEGPTTAYCFPFIISKETFSKIILDCMETDKFLTCIIAMIVNLVLS